MGVLADKPPEENSIMSQRPRIFSTCSIFFVTMATIVVIAVFTTPANSVQSGRTAAANAFSGERALAYTADVVAFGPRVSGSDAIEQTRQYIETTLQGFGYTVTRDEFTATTPLGSVQMANLVVVVPAADGAPDGPAIVLAGHYDTKQFDQFEFVGANDAGSSTGILLEFGRVLSENKLTLPVWLVFFDGEEAFVEWNATDGRYGSKYMAQRMQAAGELDQIGAMILLDMIGDADLSFPKDGNSTGWLNDIVWQTAASIGHGDVFDDGFPHFMEDDHLPFTERGVAAIDLIDFNYGPANRNWHSPFDTMDKLGPVGFQAVGETVLAALPMIGERIHDR